MPAPPLSTIGWQKVFSRCGKEIQKTIWVKVRVHPDLDFDVKLLCLMGYVTYMFFIVGEHYNKFILKVYIFSE